MTNQELAQTLRELADIYEKHPECPQLYSLGEGTELVFCHDKKSAAAAIRAFGSVEKGKTADAIVLRPKRFPTIEIHAFSSGICERVVLGTRVVPAAPERVIPAQPEHIEEIVDWHCPKSLLDVDFNEADDVTARDEVEMFF